MYVHINAAEADTLKLTLDFACGKLKSRLKAESVRDEWDYLAIQVAEEKVRLLRNKLFPPRDSI